MFNQTRPSLTQSDATDVSSSLNQRAGALQAAQSNLELVKISVIIPCYNHGHFLCNALDSVLAQTFGQWEAIVIDDGSTDTTAEVAGGYSDMRIRYIYQDNAGLSAARNRGIYAAKGGYLAFLDADDEWEAEFLSACYQRLENENSIAAVFTRCRYITPEGNLLPGIGGQEIEPEDFRSRLLEGGFFPVHAALVRATALKSGGLFDTSLTSVEDWDLWLRISEKQGLRGIAPPLARYRVYPGSMSTNTARMHANRMAVLSKIFGGPASDVSDWPDEKRIAYAFAYRTTALGYLAQGEDELGWHWMEAAFVIWPMLLNRLDTFYELACKDQQRGYRGQAPLLDIKANGREMLGRLDGLWGSAPPDLLLHKNAALGYAHLALGMLYDQAGDWAQARMHLLAAVRANRKLLRDPGVQRRLVKVSLLNPRLAALVREQRKRRNAGPSAG